MAGMKRAWQIACIAFVAFAIFWMVVSFEYPYKDRLGPGPGFFPFWLSIITGGLALALLLQVSLAKNAVEGSTTLRVERQGAFRILVILVALVGSLALLDPLGFRISLFLFLLFLPFALGERTWWVSLVFAVIGSFGVFHLFYYWLKVPLPVGVLGI
jgi:putative tricarboxylic transport membrane protein